MAKGSIDKLALVKAAAWAWYQHGSGGCDGRSVREFDVCRNSRSPRPSRYKLEAMRNTTAAPAEEEEDRSETAVSLSPSHTDMSLLDSYEIESISRQLERILASAGDYVVVEERRRRRRGRPATATARKETSGFWARHAIGFCSSSGEVVEAGAALGGRRGSRKSGSGVRLAADYHHLR